MLVERIKLLADKNNMTIAELERLAGFGKATITKWNTSSPSAEKLYKVANILSVSMEFLLNGNSIDMNNKDKNYNFIALNKANLNECFEMLTNAQQERILARIETYLEEEKQNNIVELSNNSKIKYIPKLGNTAAGFPIYLPDDYISSDLIPLPESKKADFALTVHGNSMEPDIKDGSTIYIRQTPTVEDGTVAIVAIDDTVTCKKFYKNKDNIELRSINPKYGPIIIGPNSHVKIRIIGEVVNV